MKRTLFFIMLISIVGLFPLFIKYNGFFTGGDFLNQIVPFYYETKRMVLSGAPFWSWNTFIGDDFMSIFGWSSFATPFNYVPMLFPDKYVYAGFAFSLILKFLSVGLAAFCYFRKMKMKKDYCTIGAILYAFSNFMTANLCYFYFIEPAILFPLLLIGIESVLHKEKYGPCILFASSFLVFFVDYYFAPCTMISGLIYALCRLRACDIKANWKIVSYAITIVLLGLLASSFLLVPEILHVIGGPRNVFNIGLDAPGVVGWVNRMRFLFIPDTSDAMNNLLLNGACSNEVFVPVFGMLGTILYIKNDKKSWLSILLLALLFIFATPLNGIFNFFTNPTYTRWAYTLTLMVIFASLQYVSKFDITKKAAGFYAVFTVLAYLIPLLLFMWAFKFRVNLPVTDYEIKTQYSIILLIIVNLSSLFIIVRNKRFLFPCVIVCCTLNLLLQFCNPANFDKAFSVQNARDEKTNNVIIDRFYVIDNPIPYQEANDFSYRTDIISCTDGATFANTSLLKNIPSVTSYNSQRNKVLIDLFMSADVSGKKSLNVFVPTKNRTSFDALVGVKQVIMYDDPAKQSCLPKGLVNPKLYEGYSLYDFNYYIPIGFTYDTYLLRDSVEKLVYESDIDVPHLMLENLVVSPDDELTIRKYLKKGKTDISMDLDTVTSIRRSQVCVSDIHGDTRGLTANVSLTKDDIVFFSIPCDPGFSVFVDGVETKIINANLGLSALEIKAGNHKVQFSYLTPGLKTGIVLSLLSLLLFGIMYYFRRYFFSI